MTICIKMLFFKRIYLLLWKNFLFRKKHRCATAWLIILPTLISTGIGCINMVNETAKKDSPSFSSDSYDTGGSPAIEKDVTIIEENISDIPRSFIEPLLGSGSIDRLNMLEIAFAPSNYRTKSIMEKLQAALQSINTVRHHPHSCYDNETFSGFCIPPGDDCFDIDGRPDPCPPPTLLSPIDVKIIPYQSDAVLEKDMNSWTTGNNPPYFKAAIIFREDLTVQGVYPYTIRMTGEDFFTEFILLPPERQFVGRRRRVRVMLSSGDYYETTDPVGPKNLYKRSGFRALQILLDKVIVQNKLERSSIPVPRIELQGFPFNEDRYYQEGDEEELDYDHDLDVESKYFFIHIIVLSFILCVPNTIRGIIHEKQTGIKELIKMMGLSNWMHWTAWMIDSLCLQLIVIVLMTFWLFTPFITRGVIVCSVTLWFFILILFLIATVTSLFFISTFFGKPTLAMIAGLIFYIVSYLGLVFVLDIDDVFAISLTQKLASSLFPNMALHWALKIIFDRDKNGASASWATIAQPLSALDKINILAICGMLVVDIVLYMILTVYMESVIPSEFGLRKPWYYPFLLSTWYSPKKVMPVESNKSAGADSKPGFEEEPTDLPIGIEIRNLCKTFGNKKVAVEGLSAKMYAGEVTALLGHNGAGKTTTLSILTVLYKPSSGTAYINGYNIVNQIDEVRKSVGLCPQHDLLFDELTVAQHLQFFGMLKGLSSSISKQEAQRIVFSLKLGEKFGKLASTLSGGQKRRLSLANAIIGGASVLFLDEPTSGLDPEARREVWDLLLALRTEGRTIVLTTHFMEEADVLGDRILIMAEGKLQCSGTPLFLKKCFGDGYTLTVTLTDKADRNSILSVVQKYISTATFKKGETKSVSEVAITLPEESTKTSIFPDMFSDLTKNQQKLGILTMGLTTPSMDDVFVRVGEISHSTEEVGINANEDTSNGDNVVSIKGSSLSWLMFRGLMIKLFIRNIRNLRLVLLQILPVIAIAIIVAAVSRLLFHAHIPEYPPLKMSLRSYADPITLCMPMTKEADFMCNKFFETTEGIGTTKKVHSGTGMYKYLKSERDKNSDEFKFKYVIAAEMKYNSPNDMVIKVFHSGSYSHSEPLALNAASNTILKLIQGRPTTRPNAGKIEITNHPLRTKSPTDIIEAAEYSFETYTFFIILTMAALLPLPFAMLAASFLMFPSEERVCKGKHLQLMTGVSPFLYWITSILSDLFMMILVACVMLICFVTVEPLGLYTSGYGAGVLFLIFMVYAFSVMPLSYLRSNFGSVPSEGFSGLVILHAFTAQFLVSATYYFELVGEKTYESRHRSYPDNYSVVMYNTGIVFRILFIASPTFGLTMCFIKFAAISVENNRCNLITSGLNVLCKNHAKSFKILRSCCKPCNNGIAECGSIIYCYGKLPYLTWLNEGDLNKYDRKSLSIRCYDAADSKMVGIGQELFWMFFFGVVYYILLFLMEYGILARIKKIFRPQKQLLGFQDNYPTDKDVIAEAERVHATVFRPESQMVGNRYPITDSAFVAPQEIVADNAEVLNSGDKNEDVVKSDEQQKLNEEIANDVVVVIQIEQDSVVVQNLCKSYGSFAAVSNISFGVKHGECFGLLGVNGAGKTTTFRMLIGDEFPSDGDAYAGGFSLRNNKNEFVRQFGYCPQFDPLIGFITGREMLNLYGRLRGVPPASLKRETSKWLDKLGLTDAGNLQCKTYSGGMKRRLSAGVALIGNPPIILLDEPTSGVDPVSRREFWKIISSVKDAGQAVIFTSHSMDECEALCSRLGIMVNGQFQCFGGAPHIKKKFGEGYSLTIKLKSKIPVDNPEEGIKKVMDNSKAVTNLKDEIFAKYQKVFLKEVHTNIMQYQLLDGSMTWDLVFKIMEEIKIKHEIIDEYSIGETTLEQVFLTFARQQYSDRVA